MSADGMPLPRTPWARPVGRDRLDRWSRLFDRRLTWLTLRVQGYAVRSGSTSTSAQRCDTP